MLSSFLICLTLITGTFVQDNQPAVVVTGRVVYEDTGQPATRHRVQIIPSEALLNARSGLRLPTTITDERGEFSLRHIVAGEYYVLAEPVDQRGNQQLTSILFRSGDSAADAAKLDQFKKKNLRVTVDGQRNVEVNLRVPNPHFGTISGMVFDAAHQPAAGATVHVVSKGNNPSGASVHTDDQGRYKVWGLPKGEYIVSANPPSKPRSDGEKAIDFQGSPGATYFPSTLLRRNSPAVAVLPDLDAANVDVTLISRALRNLAGSIRMRGDNRVVTNAALRLSVKQITDPASDTSSVVAEQPMSNYLSSTDKSGRWSFSNVPDGSYRLFVQTKQGGEPTEPRFVDMKQDLTVDGSDVEDLLIEVGGGARVSGVVILEEGKSSTPQHITVTATSYTPPANAALVLDETGKFVLTAAPVGEIDVSAFVSPEDQFYVKSIEANGRDLLRNKINLADGDDVRDVRIVISAGVGVITGRVLAQAGDKPVAGVELMLRRTGDDKLRLFGGKLTATTDDRGTFTLSAAPGTYLVIAWRPADGPWALTKAMDKAKREQGTGITLSPNDRKEIDIRLP
jgi:5-hydroxyisourate hydrolase-like protein (transthyretin family)